MAGALAINNTAVIPAQDLRASYITDFVSFVDRGEKTTRTYITNLRQFAAWLAFKTIRRPVRQDVICYRDYLTTEHDAIQYSPVTGWEYRTDHNGNRCRDRAEACRHTADLPDPAPFCAVPRDRFFDKFAADRTHNIHIILFFHSNPSPSRCSFK